ncbi:MAG: protein-L-isoaspartate(D-aspartate) O-methyltransferase [Candidatus Izemoplasmatales bacterium]|jgi:protein-L-isoaspartate(D-aspartate) O-methyltransferase
MDHYHYEPLRKRMVDQQLKTRGIENDNVIDAFLRVPRELFVDNTYRNLAYEDHPLPIDQNQTISQPYMVALMSELAGLDQTKSVLEIGTGSGYQTAILSLIAKTVYTVERIKFLQAKAKIVLTEAGYTNIQYAHGDGSLGWEEHAPYDAIIVTAAASEIPKPLLDQLKSLGRLVIPVGGSYFQTLMLITRVDDHIERQAICSCRFVPLLHGTIE